MKKWFKYILYILAIISLTTCKTPYLPAPVTAITNYLVVEGFINITDSTYINLSRTVNLSAKTTAKPELKATVTIESNTGNSYALKELGKGIYAAPSYSLSPANQYRLRIKTASGGAYVSDFTATVPSPPIDSVSWVIKGQSVNIYTNTHDPKNATHYYRWDFTEEWEFHTDYQTDWISNGLAIIPRLPSQNVYHCYGGDTSQNINLGTSVQLSQDVISQVMTAIPVDNEKLGIKYSIQVKQYALTKDAYDYWTLLKKNTEQLGSIFDSQPSSSIGNIHNVNVPAEPVIGYISAGSIGIQRIFISKGQLPSNIITTPAYPITPFQCGLDTMVYRFLVSSPPPLYIYPQNQYINYKQPDFVGPTFIPIMTVQAGPVPAGVNPDFLAARPICVDCTLRGSVNKPAYWQ